ncbi:MAG: YdeI/OmpD-associated family protein [Pseudomonadota bacterium]
MFLPYEFTAEIDKIDYGRMVYAVLFVPAALEAKLPDGGKSKLRIVAELQKTDGEGKRTEHAGALLPEARGKYLLLSKRVLSGLKAEIGDEVHVAFALDDPDRVDVPPVLTDAMAEEPDLHDAWHSLTPGKQRGLAYRIAQAKTEPTQIKRLDELRMELLG